MSSALVPSPKSISVDFYSRRGNKDERLINADGSAPFDAKARWFSYTFNQPVYLTEISVKVEGYGAGDKFDLEVEHVDGTYHEERIPVLESAVTLRLGKLCRAFKFKPERKWFTDPRIASVSVRGFTEAEFHQFEWAIRDFDSRLSKLTEREESAKLLEESLAELRAEKVALEAEIGKSRAELDQTQKAITSATVAASNEEEKRLLAINKRNQVREELETATKELSTKSKQLEELVKELRLFPAEIAGFIREGNRSIGHYLLIGLPFAVILSFVTYRLFSSAVDLTQLWKQDPNIDIWAVFLTRLPFVIIALAILEVCGAILARLIFEIIRINRQRMEFAKLSIIARDVTMASASAAKGMTSEKLFDRETALKMELLREHMKNYVGTEFEYRGSGLISAIKGVADRLLSRKDQS